jgi:hypothetical protein
MYLIFLTELKIIIINDHTEDSHFRHAQVKTTIALFALNTIRTKAVGK